MRFVRKRSKSPRVKATDRSECCESILRIGYLAAREAPEGAFLHAQTQEENSSPPGYFPSPPFSGSQASLSPLFRSREKFDEAGRPRDSTANSVIPRSACKETLPSRYSHSSVTLNPPSLCFAKFEHLFLRFASLPLPPPLPCEFFEMFLLESKNRGGGGGGEKNSFEVQVRDRSEKGGREIWFGEGKRIQNRDLVEILGPRLTG